MEICETQEVGPSGPVQPTHTISEIEEHEQSVYKLIFFYFTRIAYA